MSRLTHSAPLKTVHLQPVNQVLIHIKEPLLPRKENKKIRQELDLLKQLGQLELLLAKIERLELWKLKSDLKSTETILKKLYQDVSILQVKITGNTLNKSLLQVLSNEKTLYTRSMQLLLNHPKLLSISYDEQYQASHLDQLYVTACRLYLDLDLSNHKYIAYQLALLYQCINRQGIIFVDYKSRIEQRFDEIKMATKSMPFANTHSISTTRAGMKHDVQT
ncbi:hypothetical protein BD770DRAFT_440278 [Pilaira anomala]|nr:hypothetical protein BD770DRAFT_440278 [Pilaira anomala]